MGQTNVQSPPEKRPIDVRNLHGQQHGLETFCSYSPSKSLFLIAGRTTKMLLA